jgi:hypothetical protein
MNVMSDTLAALKETFTEADLVPVLHLVPLEDRRHLYCPRSCYLLYQRRQGERGAFCHLLRAQVSASPLP